MLFRWCSRPVAARRQERRGYQSGARRARNGVHPRPHQAFAIVSGGQRLHCAGQQLTVQQDYLRGGRARLHRNDSSEELPRNSELRIAVVDTPRQQRSQRDQHQSHGGGQQSSQSQGQGQGGSIAEAAVRRRSSVRSRCRSSSAAEVLERREVRPQLGLLSPHCCSRFDLQ